MKTLSIISSSRKHLRLAALFTILSFASRAQLSTKDVFEGRDLVWYGLDFTQAKFIGKFDQGFGHHPASEFEMVNSYIPAWNLLVVSEPWNFELKNTFWKKNVYYDLQPVESCNAKIKPEDIYTYNSYVLAKNRLDAMIQSYPEGDKKEGLGLVFIVEAFNKNMLLGSYWVVFFDIKTKKVLLSEYCSGKPVGFGLRNYWAGSLKNVLNDIRFFRFKSWKKAALKEIASN